MVLRVARNRRAEAEDGKMSSYNRQIAAERAHNTRCRTISAQYARQPHWTAEQIVAAAIAAKAEWQQSVAIYHRQRAA